MMVAPLTRFIRTPAMGIIMMVTSWFFRLSPGVALIGAVLLPVAVRLGLPALGAAMAMNLFGHGIALSGDYIIQGAPKLTADAAGLPVAQVMEASIPLVAVMGIVTTATAFRAALHLVPLEDHLIVLLVILLAYPLSMSGEKLRARTSAAKLPADDRRQVRIPDDVGWIKLGSVKG